jgi:hypothetical protein
MKVYSDHPMSSPVEALTLRSTKVTRLPSPASAFVEMSTATSKSVRSGTGALHVWRASQCRRTSVGIECHRFNIGRASHHFLTIEAKWSERDAPYSFRSRTLDE